MIQRKGKMQLYNRPGFSLIELMITLVIASFLIMTLNTALQQSSQARLFVKKRVKDGLFIGALNETLMYDFSGITMQYPTQVTEKSEKKEDEQLKPPIHIKRGTDNNIQEIRFFSINAREYKKHHEPCEIIYTLKETDKTKKNFTLVRTIKTHDATTQRREFEIPPITFLDNIRQCTIQFVKQQSKNKAKEEESLFILLDEWPFKEKEQEQKKGAKKPVIQSGTAQAKKQEEKKELEDISHIRITLTYVKNERGAIEAITILIPIFLNKQLTMPATPENPEPTKNEQSKKVAKTKKIEEKNKEELVLLEDRTNSMLKLIMSKG